MGVRVRMRVRVLGGDRGRVAGWSHAMGGMVNHPRGNGLHPGQGREGSPGPNARLEPLVGHGGYRLPWCSSTQLLHQSAGERRHSHPLAGGQGRRLVVGGEATPASWHPRPQGLLGKLRVAGAAAASVGGHAPSGKRVSMRLLVIGQRVHMSVAGHAL